MHEYTSAYYLPWGLFSKESYSFFSHKKATRKVERHCFYVIVRQYFIVLALCEKLSGLRDKNSHPTLEAFRFWFSVWSKCQPYAALFLCERQKSIDSACAPTSFVHLGMASEILIKQSFVDIDSRKESMSEREWGWRVGDSTAPSVQRIWKKSRVRRATHKIEWGTLKPAPNAHQKLCPLLIPIDVCLTVQNINLTVNTLTRDI